MVFIQERIQYEDGFGESVVRLVLSDDYDALFQESPAGALSTTVLAARVVREDLDEQDDGGEFRYAIAELEISASRAACVTADDEKAFWFLAQAADAAEYRFCAKIVNPVYESGVVLPECVAFRGRVQNEKDGEDLAWNPGEWLTQIDAVRELNFRAYSFDVDLLNDVKIDDLYDYIATNTPGGLDAAFAGVDEISYYLRAWQGVGSIIAYTTFANLISLNNALLTLIEAAQNLIRSRTGAASYTLTPVASDTGVQFRRTLVKPALTISSYGDGYNLHNLNVASAVLEADLVDCRLLDDGDNNPLVHAAMLHPDRDTDDGDSIERPLSVRRFQTFAEVLYAVARCFGCYLFVEFVSGSETRLSYVARKDVLKPRVYLRGATKGRLRTSLLTDNGAPPFEGQGTLYTADGVDRYRYTATMDATTPELSEARRDQGDAKNMTLFTVSASYVDSPYGSVRYGGPGLYPHNTRFYKGNPGSYEVAGEVLPESISTALYFQGISRNAENVGALTVLPAGRVSVGVGVARREYDTLSAFLNDLYARDVVAYKSEYEITVPYINGFALEVVGGVPGEMSWRFMQVGAEVVLAENTVVYNKTTGKFVTLLAEASFTAVGVERNFEDWTTTIRLHVIDRFAFGIAPPGGGVEPVEVPVPLPVLPARELRTLTGVVVCDTHRPEWKSANPHAVGECYFGAIAHGWNLEDRRAWQLTLEPLCPDDRRSMCTPEVETLDGDTIRIVTIRRDTDTANPHFVQGGGTWEFRYTLRERPQSDRGAAVALPDAQDVIDAEVLP